MKNREPIIKSSPPMEGDDTRQEERLRALFAAADPPVKPSEALRQRVAAVTEAHARPVSRRDERSRRGGRRWRALRIGLALAGAAAVALAAISIAPTLVAAQALRRMQAAISDARSMHEVAWHLNSDGSRVKTYEIWYQGGRWRFETRSHGQIQVSGGGRLWSYDPQLHQVTVRRAEGPFAYNPSGFSMTSLSRDFARWGWQTTIRMLDDRVTAGRRVHQVTITQPHDPGRLLLLVDAATDLPIQIQSQLEMNGRWTTQGLSVLHYNEPLPAVLFEPRFPSTAPVVDLDHARREWQRRLAKGIARKHVGDRTIVLRDLQVNADGDVFLLYTAGGLPQDVWRDWSIELTDELGTRYLAGEGVIEAYVPIHGRRGGKGYLFDGQKLEGAWWVPVVPQSPGKARRFTVTFHVQPVSHHGPEPVPVENFSASTSFTLRAGRPATERVPRYMAYLPSGPDDREVRSWAARTRATYYARSADPGKLEKALAFYQEVNRLREEQARELGEPVRDPQTWLETGEVLRELGRKAEARAAFEEAAREEIYPNGVRQQAEAALKALR
jgi:outer membrane lipoprotein-sorting protein